ncbi:cell surface glycoprotein 1-like [Macrobrachium rosenbergii]|uniref:cell surface glycoprotein 1-like n=1 Tax=Macrobrachium rosenbergii TaxID=79674 RepID=UPI0034D5E810
MKWIEGHTITIPTVKLQATTPGGTLLHRLGMVGGIQPSGLPVGWDLLWGSPSPTPLHSHATSSTEAQTVGKTHEENPPSAIRSGGQQRGPPSPQRDIQEEQYHCRTCKRTGHSTNWKGCPSKQHPADAPEQDSPGGSDLQLGQESLLQPNSSHLRDVASLDPLSGMPDPYPLPAPLASTEQCHAPFGMDVEPPIKEDSVPGPTHEVDPPPGDPGSLSTLIMATGEPPAPDTSSPNPSPEDEPLVDQPVTPSLGNQELATSDAEIDIALPLVVAAAGVGSPPAASETTSDFAPASPSGLSPETVPSLPPRSDVSDSGPLPRGGSQRDLYHTVA